jgi:hypothetical protein
MCHMAVILESKNVKVSLCLIKHDATKAYGGVEHYTDLIVSTSSPERFTRGERAPGTPWVGYWVGSRGILSAVKERKVSWHARE